VLSPDSVSGTARVGYVALIEDEVPFILIHPHAGVPKRYPFFWPKEAHKEDADSLFYSYICTFVPLSPVLGYFEDLT
jgi:hypothetical protein